MTLPEVLAMLVYLANLYPESNLRRIYDHKDSGAKMMAIAKAWHPFLKKVKKDEAIEIIKEYRKSNKFIIDLSDIYDRWKQINQTY